MQINKKNDFSKKHLLKCKLKGQFNKLCTTCELSGAQTVAILLLSMKKSTTRRLFSLTGNQSKFLRNENYEVWLLDFSRYLSPLLVSDECFDESPTKYRGEFRFADPVLLKTFDFASPTECNVNILKRSALGPKN